MNVALLKGQNRKGDRKNFFRGIRDIYGHLPNSSFHRCEK